MQVSEKQKFQNSNPTWSRNLRKTTGGGSVGHIPSCFCTFFFFFKELILHTACYVLCTRVYGLVTEPTLTFPSTASVTRYVPGNAPVIVQSTARTQTELEVCVWGGRQPLII